MILVQWGANCEGGLCGAAPHIAGAWVVFRVSQQARCCREWTMPMRSADGNLDPDIFERSPLGLSGDAKPRVEFRASLPIGASSFQAQFSMVSRA